MPCAAFLHPYRYTADVYAAKLIPGVDLIIGGHSHSFLWHDKNAAPVYDKGEYTLCCFPHPIVNWLCDFAVDRPLA